MQRTDRSICNPPGRTGVVPTCTAQEKVPRALLPTPWEKNQLCVKTKGLCGTEEFTSDRCLNSNFSVSVLPAAFHLRNSNLCLPKHLAHLPQHNTQAQARGPRGQQVVSTRDPSPRPRDPAAAHLLAETLLPVPQMAPRRPGCFHSGNCQDPRPR